jgi:indolepyruvate ferredoxin oxidoreductase
LSELESRMPEAMAAARELLATSGFSDEVRRLAEIRVPELILYQNASYARQYVDFLRNLVAVEERRVPSRTELSEAVARYLFKLMASKDEYEVARLLLKDEFLQRVRAEFGEDARLAFHLHPPLLRALGLTHKLRLGMWFAPVLKALRALRGVRGTPFDLFGYARVRRVERALISEYRQLIEGLLPDLNEDNYQLAVQLAELPDMIRGYEEIKLASVAAFRRKAAELRKQFREAGSAMEKV